MNNGINQKGEVMMVPINERFVGIICFASVLSFFVPKATEAGTITNKPSRTDFQNVVIPDPPVRQEKSKLKCELEALLAEKRGSDAVARETNGSETAAPTSERTTSRFQRQIEENTVIEDIYVPTATTGEYMRRTVLEGHPERPPILIESRVRRDTVTGEEFILSEVAMVADELIIKKPNGVSFNLFLAEIEALGGAVLGKTGSTGYYVIDFPYSNANSLGNMEELLCQHSDHIGSVERNYLVSPSVLPSDEFLELLWGLHNTGQDGGTADMDIDAEEGWDINHSAPEVIVAVVDSGARLTHLDLEANLWVNVDEVAGNGLDDDNNGIIDDVHGVDFVEREVGGGATGDPSDEFGHGTHVAGTIGARANNFYGEPPFALGVTGVVWEVQLMICRVLDENGSGFIVDVISGIAYARANGAHVVNLSLGGTGFNQAFADEIEAAQGDFGGNGTMFSIAAGNDGTDNDFNPVYPASYDFDNVVAVANADRNGNRYSTSNYGLSSVDLSAPGSGIVSTSFAGDFHYAAKNGTSMAAPHVSGVLALLNPMFPFDDYFDSRRRILSSVEYLADFEGETATEGMLDLEGALYLWSNGVDLGGGWLWIDWIEFFNDNFHPWIFHSDHGWLFTDGDGSTTDIFFYDLVLGWMWTAEDVYPYLYRFDTSSWFFYSLGTTDPRWFCDLSLPPESGWGTYDVSGGVSASSPPDDPDDPLPAW